MQDNFDFIIIGGGSAGCVLANRLSANSKNQVCLLEAGGKNSNILIKTPIATAVLMRLKRFNYCFDSIPQPQQNNRTIYNPRGRGLGGSSAINAMLYTRGQAEDYDDWAAAGNDGWSYNDVLPYFISTECQQRIDNEFHGRKGELNVADSRSAHPIGVDFIQSGINAGYPFNPDFNGKQQSGVGYYQVTQKNGQRHSAAAAFIDPILPRNNLTILTDCKVDKLQINNKAVTGVRYWSGNSLMNLSANKEVIMCAGAIHSPQLLMLSGIGPKAQLQAHKIDIEHELPGVGKNLQDHVDAIIVNRHNRENLISLRPKPFYNLLKQGVRYLRHKTGTFSTSIVESGGFFNSDKDQQRPTLQWQFVTGAMDDHGRNLKMFLEQGISTHVCLLRPNSRGEITLQSNNSKAPPLINTNMLSDPSDVEQMVKAVHLTRQLLSTAPLGRNNLAELIPGEDVKTDADIEKFLRSKSNNIYHPVGTCKMGNDELAVVDNTLKVHGIKNLRVVDASIMPTLVSANTNAPTIMIAAKAADMILADNP